MRGSRLGSVTTWMFISLLNIPQARRASWPRRSPSILVFFRWNRIWSHGYTGDLLPVESQYYKKQVCGLLCASRVERNIWHRSVRRSIWRDGFKLKRVESRANDSAGDTRGAFASHLTVLLHSLLNPCALDPSPLRITRTRTRENIPPEYIQPVKVRALHVSLC